MSLQLNPKTGLMFAALAVGALYLMKRAQAQSLQATQKQQAIAQGSQTYSTPTSVAAALGAFIASYTKNATPTVRTDNVVNYDWKPVGSLSDYFKPNPNEPLLGLFSFGTDVRSNDAAWSGPLASLVNSPSYGNGSTDSVASGGIYDVGTDFVKNAFGLFGT